MRYSRCCVQTKLPYRVSKALKIYNTMRALTNVNPLITRFMVPRIPETVDANDVKIIYDPHEQTTSFYMGGKGKPSRSYDGYKDTKEEKNSTIIHHNDAERWTDD